MAILVRLLLRHVDKKRRMTMYQPCARGMFAIAGAPDIVVPQTGANATSIATMLINFTILSRSVPIGSNRFDY